mgnify:CR=1 FL=1
MPNSPWPSWLPTKVPSWLEPTGYPFSGIGDLGDLKFKVATGHSGKWVGFLNTGWYYFNNQEQYNYVLKGSQTVVAAAGSGVATAGVSYRPVWGPVLVTSSNGAPYTQHHNGFWPATTLSWSVFASGAGIYVATLPTSSVLLGLRNLTNLPLGSVAGTGLILSETLYYYDPVGGQLYTKPSVPSSIQIWADIVYRTPRIRFRELVVQENSGVQASYPYIEGIQVSRGNQIVSVTGVVTGGYFTHTATGISTGDWVVLEYNIQKSFCIVDHQTLQCYTTSGTGDTITIDFETSIPTAIQALSLNASGAAYTGLLDLNPLYSDAHRAGYLFHGASSSPVSSIWLASQVLTSIYPATVCGAWGQPFKIAAIVLGANGLPVPWAPITLVLSTGASALSYLPNLTSVDGRGEFHCLVLPPTGAGLCTIYVVSRTVSGYASGSVLTPSQMVSTTTYQGGHAVLVISDQLTPKGYHQGYANATYADGVPRPATAMLIRSALASILELGNNLHTGTLYLDTTQSAENIAAVVGFGYLPQKGDRLVGIADDGQSSVIEVLDE